MKINELQDENRPECYVLVGVPGSGKSTWTKKLRATSSREYVVVSSDDVLERLAAPEGLTYAQAFAKYMGFADQQAQEAFEAAIAAKQNIVYDRTNLTVKRRKDILRQLTNEYIKVAVVFNTTDAEVTRRLATREQETGKHIPPGVMKDMYAKWQAPSKAEGFDRIIKV